MGALLTTESVASLAAEAAGGYDKSTKLGTVDEVRDWLEQQHPEWFIGEEEAAQYYKIPSSKKRCVFRSTATTLPVKQSELESHINDMMNYDVPELDVDGATWISGIRTTDLFSTSLVSRAGACVNTYTHLGARAADVAGGATA